MADGPAPRPGCAPCRPDTVAAHRVAGQLAAHGAGRSPQHRRHRPQRMAVGQPQAQGFTFFGTQVSIGSRSHGNTVAHPGVTVLHLELELKPLIFRLVSRFYKLFEDLQHSICYS